MYIEAEIVTDACPFGMAGILRIQHRAVEFFMTNIGPELLDKFKAQGQTSHFGIAARLWLKRLGYGATVRFKTDNLATVLMMTKGKGKTPEMNVVAREFSFDSATKECGIHWFEQIYGVTNVEAEALSRQFVPFP